MCVCAQQDRWHSKNALCAVEAFGSLFVDVQRASSLHVWQDECERVHLLCPTPGGIRIKSSPCAVDVLCACRVNMYSSFYIAVRGKKDT